MPSFKDLTGQKFSRLRVLRQVENNHHNQTQWLSRCECGTEIVTRSMDLTTGNTKSCGCLKADVQRERMAAANFKHGASIHGERSRAYIAWMNIIQRCENENVPNYGRYGGRGIRVCERWRNSFADFLADMGDAPVGYSIDRKDNDKDYSPENCRWASKKVQANNMSTNFVIEFAGERHSLQEWSRLTGIPRKTISNRINRLGWSIQEALTTKPSPVSRSSRK